MKNQKQKITLASCIGIILITGAVWAMQGFHLFTHERILMKLPQSEIEKMLGQPPREVWVNHFTLGLEYTLAIAAAAIILSTILFFVFKTRKDLQ